MKKGTQAELRIKRKEKRAFILTVMLLFAALGLAWGLVTAYINTYNMVNYKNITAVDYQLVGENKVKVDVLDKSKNVDISFIKEDNKLYYLLYLSASEKVRTIIEGIELFEKTAEG